LFRLHVCHFVWFPPLCFFISICSSRGSSLKRKGIFVKNYVNIGSHVLILPPFSPNSIKSKCMQYSMDSLIPFIFYKIPYNFNFLLKIFSNKSRNAWICFFRDCFNFVQWIQIFNSICIFYCSFYCLGCFEGLPFNWKEKSFEWKLQEKEKLEKLLENSIMLISALF
jgi:hypothetical protein